MQKLKKKVDVISGKSAFVGSQPGTSGTRGGVFVQAPTRDALMDEGCGSHQPPPLESTYTALLRRSPEVRRPLRTPEHPDLACAGSPSASRLALFAGALTPPEGAHFKIGPPCPMRKV